MSKKKNDTSRRGFLKRLGVGAATVGAVTVMPSDANAKSDDLDLPPWDLLIAKAETGKVFSKKERVAMAFYMNESKDYPKVIHAWSALNSNIDNLVRIHPYVAYRIVRIATGEYDTKDQQVFVDGECVEPWNLKEDFS